MLHNHLSFCLDLSIKGPLLDMKLYRNLENFLLYHYLRVYVIGLHLADR